RHLDPTIVAVGTPAGTHMEMIPYLLEQRRHVFVDKPLGTNAAHARALYEQAARAGVKTAYAASFRYQPQALLAARLVQQGHVGRVLEVECVSHYNWPRLTSFGWPHRLDQGGGRLNNNFTHKLAIVLRVVGGSVLAAMGETRNDLKRVPVGPRIHDFRDFTQLTLTAAEAAQAEWREVDSDWSYTALLRIGDPGRPEDAVSATFRHSCLLPAWTEDYIAFYGDEGAIHIDGAYASGEVRLKRKGIGWEELPVPGDINDNLPAIADSTQRNWTQLAREFCADLRGEGNAGYLSFRDGWLFQETIDAVRAGSGWVSIPV
ncbi:MAG: Gfo/Idh/MocA family oxidoreductase, partial [Armatimonadetes bacterium]|nr:Gfo/Idh/MocA family oxidoreductase [Armatimonadota bacterium]